MEIGLSTHFTYKKLMRFVLPTIVMMIVTSIYSIVDGFFVSNFVGKNSFAAVNLIMPVLMALGSFGFMIGTGGTALISKNLGMKNKQKANEILTFLVLSISTIGIILSAVAYILMPQIAVLLGASDLIIDDCVIYGRILVCGNTFFMLQNSFQSFLVAAEKPKLGLLISVAAGLTNIFLDFMLVYVFRLGIVGAAAATVLSQVIGGLVPLIYFLRNKKGILKFVKPKADFASLGRTCLNGSSEMLTNLSSSFVGLLYNFQLIKIAAENGIAAYGVMMYVGFVFMAFYFGFSIGTAPIIGYNYGAENRVELRNVFKKSLIVTLIAAVVMTVAAQILALPLSRIFVGYDEELLALTVNGMRLYSLSFLLSGLNVFGSSLFTALNNGMVSAAISLGRTLVFQVAAILILPILFDIDGVWLAVVAAEVLSVIVTFAFIMKNKKKYGYFGNQKA